MKSLLLRFFISFWLIIGITIGLAAVGGFWYAERMRDAYESFEVNDLAREASAALASAGRDGLKVWLSNYTKAGGIRILVIERNGRELLDRPIPRTLIAMLNRQRRAPPPDREKRDPDNFRPARPLTQLIGPNGARYTFFLVPHRDSPFFERGLPGRGMLLFVALFVSAVMSLLMARTVSRPVQRLRDATREIAEGNLDSRVAESVSRRSDELGLLGRDFDAMADSLLRSALRQTELSRNVSHELRSPLARLRVALELARQKAGDLTEFDRIDQESERLDELIGQILSYSRIEAITDADKQRVNLNELLSDVVDDVNFECRSSGAGTTSVQSILDENIHCRAHAESIRSAIENLLRNAVRHTKRDSDVSVTLSGNASGIVITVEDEGPGVKPAEIDRMFEPFFRTSSSSGDHAGTGLGLAIVRRAVELHGGSVRAANRHESGLIVTIEIPG